jgi:hypothetical protein
MCYSGMMTYFSIPLERAGISRDICGTNLTGEMLETLRIPALRIFQKWHQTAHFQAWMIVGILIYSPSHGIRRTGELQL